jgi:hypothetical protein
MSLDRFIFCPCKHALESHGDRGCQTCSCAARQREVIDRLLEHERDEIHRTWLGAASNGSGPAMRASR